MTFQLRTGEMMTRRNIRDRLSREAFAAYLRQMRDLLGLQNTEIIERMRETASKITTVHPKDMWELMSGQRMPRGPIMTALTDVLNLDVHHIERATRYGSEVVGTLTENSVIDLDEMVIQARSLGHELAQQRVKDRTIQQALDHIAEGVPPEQVQQALAILDELYQQSPERAKQYLALGTFFIQQDKKTS